jgi:energy-coupling factor transport system permease protein
MKRTDAFSAYHPIIGFLYFAFVILETAFFLHPVLLAISFASAMAYSIYLNGGRALRFNLLMVLPLMILAAVINPAFNHEGLTILGYVRGNPITLESILYGIAAAAMIGAVIVWFSCYNAVMTSDKFIYLFGRLIPSLSLIIAMALRFIPAYKSQIVRIIDAQRGIGRDISSGNLLARMRSGLSILSVMVTWALENAIETADSMKARGYGLRGRTAYALYRFDGRDRLLFAFMICGFALLFFAGGTRVLSVQYFPAFSVNDMSFGVCFFYVVHAVICNIPLAMDIREDFVWRSLRSKV